MKTVNKIKGWIGKLIPYVFGVLLATGLTLFLTYGKYDISEMEEADALNILLMLALVTVTLFYAKAAKETADAAKQQAESSLRMAEMASRPLIIQRAVTKREALGANYVDCFEHFLIMNAGNGPAIELEISLLDKERRLMEGRRQTYLRAGEETVFTSDLLAQLEESQYYLLCEYQRFFYIPPQKIWDQTWLPLKLTKASTEGEIYVSPGELEFENEVLEKDRIGTFQSWSKPK